ncbi:MAG: hypothetical protein AB8B65_12710 [Kordia sp.]|uniref:hypothetical protein n=1 Tax=Kordia sp. TaxID=1965332 RepID=UPI00385CC809
MMFIITMSLYHASFPDVPKELESHKYVYKSIIKDRDRIDKELVNKLLSNSLTREEYADTLIKHKQLFKQKLRDCNKEKKAIVHNFTFNGRSSFHYWFFVFGLSFSFLILALRYTYKLVYKLKGGYLKKSLIFESVGWIAISLFWVLHTVFKKTDDLPNSVYILVVFSISILISISIFFLLKHLANRKHHTLKSYKASVINLIELVGDIRVNHYFHIAAKAINKDNEKIISKDSEIMDKKIFTTLEKVADGRE